MLFTWTTGLINLGVGVVIAVISTLITVHLSLKRFRFERWWDRRADVYASIIEALHHVKRGTQDSLKACYEEPRVDKDRKKQLTEKYFAGWDEIHKAVNTGSFLLPKVAQDALKTLMKEVDKADKGANAPDFNVYDAYSARLGAICKCLGVLPAIAKKDLLLPR